MDACPFIAEPTTLWPCLPCSAPGPRARSPSASTSEATRECCSRGRGLSQELRSCVVVVGPGEGASADAVADAAIVGRLIAERGWVMLSGGRAAGVMAAATRGASEAGGLTVGILPNADKRDAAPELTIALPTGLGEARNAVLVTAADAVIACGMNPGTASEVALALRARKPTVLVRPSAEAKAFFERVAGGSPPHVAESSQDAVSWVARQLGQ